MVSLDTMINRITTGNDEGVRSENRALIALLTDPATTFEVFHTTRSAGANPFAAGRFGLIAKNGDETKHLVIQTEAGEAGHLNTVIPGITRVNGEVQVAPDIQAIYRDGNPRLMPGELRELLIGLIQNKPDSEVADFIGAVYANGDPKKLIEAMRSAGVEPPSRLLEAAGERLRPDAGAPASDPARRPPVGGTTGRIHGPGMYDAPQDDGAALLRDPQVRRFIAREEQNPIPATAKISDGVFEVRLASGKTHREQLQLPEGVRATVLADRYLVLDGAFEVSGSMMDAAEGTFPRMMFSLNRYAAEEGNILFSLEVGSTSTGASSVDDALSSFMGPASSVAYSDEVRERIAANFPGQDAGEVLSELTRSLREWNLRTASGYAVGDAQVAQVKESILPAIFDLANHPEIASISGIHARFGAGQTSALDYKGGILGQARLANGGQAEFRATLSDGKIELAA